MKANFKRLLSAIAALAMTATCLSAATMPTFFASAEDATGNVAVGYGTAYDCGKEIYGAAYSVGALNDGVTDSSSQWQLKTKGAGDYAGISFTVPVQANSFRALGTGFADSANKSDKIMRGGYVVEYYDGAQWVDVTANAGEDGNWLTVTFEAATTLTDVRFTFNTFDEYAVRLLEIEVDGTIASIDVARADLKKVIAKANALTSTDYTAVTWAEVETALTTAETALAGEDETAMSDAAAAIETALAGLEFDAADKLAKALAAAGEVKRYKYTAASIEVLDGYLAEAATYEGVTVDANNAPAIMACAENIQNSIAALEKANLAIGATATADTTHPSYAGPASYVNDGNLTSRWQSENNLSDTYTATWVQLEFAAATTVDTFDFYWEASRPSVNGTAIQYSQDGVVWSDATATFTGDLGTKLNDTGADYYFNSATIAGGVKAKFIRIYMTEAYDKDKMMSLYEVEIYNAAGTELAEANEVAAFEVRGAQVRANADNAEAYDLRFVVTFSSALYAEIEAGTITDLGVVLEKMADGTTKTVSTEYLRNVELAKYGKYTYTVTILGITDAASEWGCTAFYTTEAGNVETAQIVRTAGGAN